MSYLHYLCLFTPSGVQHILCCVFVLFFFVLCALSCQCLWIVHYWLPLRCSLTFIWQLRHLHHLNIRIRIIFSLSMLITFCLFSEYAITRNSSIFDLNGVYSVNNTLSPTPVPARLRCVITLVDYLLLCVVKLLFLCVLCVDIYFMRYVFHIFYSCLCLLFRRFFHCKIVFKFILL